MNILAIAVLLALIAPADVLSEPLSSDVKPVFKFHGKIVEQPTMRQINDSRLNPDNEILELSDWKNRFYADLNFNAYYKDLKFISKFRPTLLIEDETKYETVVDDAYLDLRITDVFFFYLGKRNVRNGVGISYNPTDFLGEGKAVDLTKREEDRRMEREGNYLAGLDAFFDNLSLTAIFAPKIDSAQEEDNRALFKVDFFFENLNTDLSFEYYDSIVPGIGTNLSVTLGNSLVIYTESAFRKGSERRTIRKISDTTSAVYEVVESGADDTIYTFLVAGGHYTFKNGTILILEYIYNGDGFNKDEWNEYQGFVEYSRDGYLSETGNELMKANLLLANDLMEYREMRKNYFFARLSNSEIKDKIDGALAFLLNIDDRSFVINPSLEYRFNDDISMGWFARVFTGGSGTEFGLIPWYMDSGIMINYYF